MSQAPGPEPSAMPVTRAELLAMKVSAILESRPGALEVLIEHGFAPLKQPHLRSVLAHTVTLTQALRIRSLADDKQRVLVDELLALFGQAVDTSAGLSGEAVS